MKEQTNAITDQMIQEWKAEWGKIFRTVVDGVPYIWRKLRRKEYTALMTQSTEMSEQEKLFARQEQIVQLTVLYPENIAELIEENAGLATTLGDEVIYKSGFDYAGTEEL